jgi:hypothetical protein
MKRIPYIIGLASVAILSLGCVHLLQIPLDTATDNDPYYVINSKPNTDYVNKFTAIDIFTEDIKSTWGFEKDACKNFTVSTDIKYAGDASLSLEWDKSKKGCDWLGVGFAWNNWQNVDMSTVIDTWAVSLWVRTKTGKMPTIPLTFNFIDQTSKATEYISVSNKFYEGSGIDTIWKQVTIPLSYFRFKSKGLNLTEITQLIMTFEGTASIFIDEFKFIPLSSVKNSGTVAKFSATDLFKDEAKNTWGFEKDACREFTVVNDVKKQGSSSLYMKWDKTQKGCDVISAGFAWNNWNAVNMSEIVDTWALHFWIRTKQGKMATIPLSMNFMDDGNNTSDNISINNKFYKGAEIDESWKEVTIPLSNFRFKENGLNLLEIKQMVMTFEGTAEIYLDELQLINTK